MRAFILCFIVFCSVIIILFSSITFFAYPLKYKEHIKEAASSNDVDPVLVASIIRAESGFDESIVSPRGAIGLMQIMPSTGEFIASKIGKTQYNLANPKDNIEMGTYYIKYLLSRFPDLRTALMAYNAGEGNVARWLSEQQVDRLTTSPYPETNAYVERVLNNMNYYRKRI